MKRIGFAGSDGRTLLSALVTSRSGKGDEFRGTVIRGMPAMKPYTKLMNWPVDFIDVPGASTTASYIEAAVSALHDGQIAYLIPMPEALQFEGFVDAMITAGLGDRVCGLTKEASFLEGDKAACYQFCDEAEVPVAPEWIVGDLRDYRLFLGTSLKYLEHHGGLYVKFPYSAAGKGSRFIGSPWDIRHVYQGLLDDYGKTYEKLFPSGKPWPILFASYMNAIEVSFTALVDQFGHFQILPTGMDYQGRYSGPITTKNTITGGMASVSPHPVQSPALLKLARKQIFEPFIEGMRRKKILRPCILYPGCMVYFNADGCPWDIRLCEMNIRAPEPEFQTMAWLIKNFGHLVEAIFKGNLDEVVPEIRNDQIAMTLALVTGPGPGSEYPGYPWRHKPGEPMVLNLSALKKNNVTMIPAGMGYNEATKTFVSDGTRVAYLIGAVTVSGKARSEVANELRAKLYRLFEAGVVRTIPSENPMGNRLVVRDDVGTHFMIAEQVFHRTTS